MITDNTVLSIACDEPEGAVVRHVHQMSLTPLNLKKFWDKSRKFVTIFNEEVRGDFKKFLEVFLREGPSGIECRGLFWVIDDFVGIMYLVRRIQGKKVWLGKPKMQQK